MSDYLTNSVPVTSVSLSGDTGIDALIMGTKWGGVIGTGVALTFSFPTTSSLWSPSVYPGSDGENEPADMSALGAAHQQLVRTILDGYASVANITFAEVADDATTVGELRFAWTYNSPGFFGSNYIAKVADFPSDAPDSGDVWLNRYYQSSYLSNTSVGSYAYWVVAHETGHTLGLKHPFMSTGISSVTLPSNHRSVEYSVMNYDAKAGYSGSTVNFTPTTPMWYDIKALQHLYGANTSYNAGDTVYSFNEFQNYNQTIWDGGGNDTIVFNSASSSSVIDLRPGQWSDLGLPLYFYRSTGSLIGSDSNTVIIYEGVIIENAVGGGGNDKITGNTANNILTGNGGDDTLDGGTGIDTLIGGLGNDVYYLGDVNDVVTENPGEGDSDTVLTPANTYTLNNAIENVYFNGTGNFIGIGNDVNNYITGGSGNDSLVGYGGNDTLSGYAGMDTLIGGAGDDTYDMDTASDVLVEQANEGHDIIYLNANLGSYALGDHFESLLFQGAGDFIGIGNSANNYMRSGNGADSLVGGSGNDTLTGQGGQNTLEGGQGDDVYIVSNGADFIVEQANEGHDVMQGAQSSWPSSYYSYGLWANIEDFIQLSSLVRVYVGGNELSNHIVGNALNDTLSGGQGNDTLEGENGNDLFYGDDGNDTIIGGQGHDTLDGNAGSDSLSGGLGNDIYYVDSFGDSVVENGDEGTDWVYSTVAHTLSDNLENLDLSGSTNTGTGNAGGNLIRASGSADYVMYGLLGNDTLSSGSGNDTMHGGGGNDTYIVNGQNDNVVELTGEGEDTVQAAVNTYTISNAIETLVFTGSGNFTGHGNTTNNSITGGTGNDSLYGEEGNDTLAGLGGQDSLIGGDGDDVYWYNDPTDVFVEQANEGHDVVRSTVVFAYPYTIGDNVEDFIQLTAQSAWLIGNALDNHFIGNNGFNYFVGGAGNDTLEGGIEINHLEGGTGHDYLSGGSFMDYLDGGEGSDTMIGGGRDDTYYVDSINDVIVENLNEGADLVVVTSATYALPDHVENMFLTGLALSGTGNAIGNRLQVYNSYNSAGSLINGLAGDDSLFGSEGADTIDGGDDNDSIYGGAGNDYLMGGNGADTITGDAGADTMNGGAGNDSYYVDDMNDVIVDSGGIDSVVINTSSYTLTAEIENVIIELPWRRAAVQGNNSANAITGNHYQRNTLSGMGGDDTLDGGGDTGDTLIGGAGNDLFIVDITGVWNSSFTRVTAKTDTAQEGKDQGYDTFLVRSSGWGAAYTIVLPTNIEVLDISLTSASNFILVGNTTGNLLIGNNENNTLNGLAGADTLEGGDGDDTYIVDNIDDVIIEQANEGDDLIQSYITYTLGSNLEELTLMGTTAINGTGNADANIIRGNTAANILDGAGGNDHLEGGEGNDTYIVDAGDSIIESFNGGFDTVLAGFTYVLDDTLEALTLTGADNIDGFGHAGKNLLIGNEGDNLLQADMGADTLAGGDGDDTLNGGAGKDRLDGGAGNDAFFFDAMPLSSREADTILSFGQSAGDTDIIHISLGVFTALSGLGTLSLAEFAIGSKALDADDRIIYNATNGKLYYDADGTGTAAKAIQIALIGTSTHPTLQNTGFTIVV